MPDKKWPRHGSMQFWPRKRAKRIYPRVRAWASKADIKPLGFAGYKAGMTHLMITDNRKSSTTKGEDISCPVTIIECPPLKVASIKLYKKAGYGKQTATEIPAKIDKELERKIPKRKKIDEKKADQIKPEDYEDITLIVYTQPKMTGLGKKKPELFEVGIGGKSIQEKFSYAKERLGKEITIKEVLGEGEQVDIHAVSKGKGYQGPVKRFGIKIRTAKSEKTKRGPGSISGGWKAQGHMMYRVAHAGQTGFHTRTEYNKQIMKIGDNADDINPKGGFIRYGLVKNPYIILKGSVPGPRKRLVRFNVGIRPNKKITAEAPAIQYISTDSRQKR